MSTTKVPYGRPVKLLLDFQGFPDGRLVLFEIWRRKDQKEEKVCEVFGATKGGKATGQWVPEFEERKEVLPLEKQIQGTVVQEKYYFIAKIDDKEAKSGDLVFTYPLDIYLKDELGQAVDGAEFKITFSDGSQEKGVFEKGHAKIAEAVSGKFSLELKDYEFEEGSLGSANCITGKVSDPSGKPIQGATVTITGDGREYKLQTDGEGVYRLDNMSPGKYTLIIEAKGYATIEKEGEVK